MTLAQILAAAGIVAEVVAKIVEAVGQDEMDKPLTTDARDKLKAEMDAVDAGWADS